jgi:hypothetical protein
MNKVENGLDRAKVLRFLDRCAKSLEGMSDVVPPIASNVIWEVRKALTGPEYDLSIDVDAALVEENRLLRGYLEDAAHVLREHFYQPKYVGSQPFEAVERALWHLEGEPDGGE